MNPNVNHMNMNWKTSMILMPTMMRIGTMISIHGERRMMKYGLLMNWNAWRKGGTLYEAIILHN